MPDTLPVDRLGLRVSHGDGLRYTTLSSFSNAQGGRMLGRIILIALQLAIGWFGAPLLLRYLPTAIGGDFVTLIHGALFGVIAWVVGLVGAQALKDVATPSPQTLLWAVAGGLIGAALVVFKVPAMIPIKVVPMFFPLALAILGYAIKR
jgi:hypothetical protein